VAAILAAALAVRRKVNDPVALVALYREVRREFGKKPDAAATFAGGGRGLQAYQRTITDVRDEESPTFSRLDGRQTALWSRQTVDIGRNQQV
jgi:hypothetical protein